MEAEMLELKANPKREPEGVVLEAQMENGLGPTASILVQNGTLKVGDVVQIKDGAFMGYEGNVQAIDETRGRLTVIISIFGRSTPVDLEFWQVEQAV